MSKELQVAKGASACSLSRGSVTMTHRRRLIREELNRLIADEVAEIVMAKWFADSERKQKEFELDLHDPGWRERLHREAEEMRKRFPVKPIEWLVYSRK